MIKENQLFNILFALLSGSIAMFVYVLTGDKPMFTLLIAMGGFIIAILVFMKMHILNLKIDEKLKELKDAE